jgi:diguanylate cyclase (GGDEF)-like protein
MYMGLSKADGVALRGLLEMATDDIVVRIDPSGFIEAASPNIARLGHDLSQLLFKPHLADLAHPHHAPDLKKRIESVLSGAPDDNGLVEWYEFRAGGEGASDDGAAVGDGPDEGGPDESGRMQVERWLALSLRALVPGEGDVQGAMGLLRSIDHKRALEGEAHARAHVDPLTGLANRHAFCAALDRHLAAGSDGVLAMFEIDRMRAVFMQYGQRTGDEIVWGFARFLETMVNEQFELAQFAGERFCIILKGLSPRASRRWAEEVLKTFASLALTTSSRIPRLGASAGLAPIERSVDATLREAELALVMARARGGMRVVQSGVPGARRVGL